MRPGDRIVARYHENSGWKPATVVVASYDDKEHLIVNFDNFKDEVRIPVTRTRSIPDPYLPPELRGEGGRWVQVRSASRLFCTKK